MICIKVRCRTHWFRSTGRLLSDRARPVCHLSRRVIGGMDRLFCRATDTRPLSGAHGVFDCEDHLRPQFRRNSDSVEPLDRTEAAPSSLVRQVHVGNRYLCRRIDGEYRSASTALFLPELHHHGKLDLSKLGRHEKRFLSGILAATRKSRSFQQGLFMGRVGR